MYNFLPSLLAASSAISTASFYAIAKAVVFSQNYFHKVSYTIFMIRIYHALDFTFHTIINFFYCFRCWLCHLQELVFNNTCDLIFFHIVRSNNRNWCNANTDVQRNGCGSVMESSKFPILFVDSLGKYT